jgi:hypothetical protein
LRWLSRRRFTALARVLTTLATSIVERLPVDFIPRDYPFGVRNQPAAKAGKNNEEGRPTLDRRRKPMKIRHRRHLRRLRLLDSRLYLCS